MLPTRPRTKGASSAELEILGKSDRIVAYCLLRHGPASQAALGAATGLSPPTVRAALTRLADRGLAEMIPGQDDTPLSRDTARIGTT
jgi:DNA-binding MarR family transcriptional regulator